MKPRSVARAITGAGWCAGMVLILAGWPLPAVLAVPVASVSAAVAVMLWGPRAVRLKAVVKRLPLRRPKTGAAVEHA